MRVVVCGLHVGRLRVDRGVMMVGGWVGFKVVWGGL